MAALWATREGGSADVERIFVGLSEKQPLCRRFRYDSRVYFVAAFIVVKLSVLQYVEV